MYSPTWNVKCAQRLLFERERIMASCGRHAEVRFHGSVRAKGIWFPKHNRCVDANFGNHTSLSGQGWIFWREDTGSSLGYDDSNWNVNRAKLPIKLFIRFISYHMVPQ